LASISRRAIALARSLAEELWLDARFVCADLYDLPACLTGHFNIVFTSYSVLPWLPRPSVCKTWRSPAKSAGIQSRMRLVAGTGRRKGASKLAVSNARRMRRMVSWLTPYSAARRRRLSWRARSAMAE